jgi:hypothetical protein
MLYDKKQAMSEQEANKERASWRWPSAGSGIISGSIQLQDTQATMEAERINALSALLNDLTSREAELRRYL